MWIWWDCQLYTKLCFRHKCNALIRWPNSSHTRYERAITSSINCECNLLRLHKWCLLKWIQKVFWTRWFFTQMKLQRHFIQCFLQSNIDPFKAKEHPEFLPKLFDFDLIIHLQYHLRTCYSWQDSWRIIILLTKVWNHSLLVCPTQNNIFLNHLLEDSKTNQSSGNHLLLKLMMEDTSIHYFRLIVDNDLKDNSPCIIHFHPSMCIWSLVYSKSFILQSNSNLSHMLKNMVNIVFHLLKVHNLFCISNI